MKKKFDQPLTRLADAAFQQAARRVIERAEETGTPVIVWEHEALTEVEPRETPAARAKRNRRATGK
jgi:hypothetical protein